MCAGSDFCYVLGVHCLARLREREVLCVLIALSRYKKARRGKTRGNKQEI